MRCCAATAPRLTNAPARPTGASPQPTGSITGLAGGGVEQFGDLDDGFGAGLHVAYRRGRITVADHGHPLKPRTIQTALGELEAAGLARGSEEGNGRARYWSPATSDDGAGGGAGTP